jgi:hypothetical protein
MRQLADELLHLVKTCPKRSITDRTAVERWLDVPLDLTEDRGPFSVFAGTHPSKLFGDVELRVSNLGPWLFVVVSGSPEAELAAPDSGADGSRGEWGPFSDMSISPDVPPEGVVSYRHDQGPVEVWLSFRAKSKVFSSASFSWRCDGLHPRLAARLVLERRGSALVASLRFFPVSCSKAYVEKAKACAGGVMTSDVFCITDPDGKKRIDYVGPTAKRRPSRRWDYAKVRPNKPFSTRIELSKYYDLEGSAGSYTVHYEAVHDGPVRSSPCGEVVSNAVTVEA